MSSDQFVYKFKCNGDESKLTVPLIVPLYGQTVDELTGRLLKAHFLPMYIEKELRNELDDFVKNKTRTLHEDNGEEVLEKLRSGESSIDSLVAQWTKAFQDEVKVHRVSADTHPAEVFSEVYHSLIHSPALETLLNLEHTYAMSVQDILTQRDLDLQHLERRQAEEMERALANVGSMYTDDQINQLAQRNFENTQLIESKWATELGYLEANQKKEYREWVSKVHEDSTGAQGTQSYIQRVRALTNSMRPVGQDSKSYIHMEESFTIHLGAQMKTTHNLRLLSANALDLCRHRPNEVVGMMLPQPQRLHTALSLYSNNLAGLVLLVDDRLNFYTGIKREFSKVCEQSTDFHFPCLEEQFSGIEEQVVKTNDWRQELKLAAGERDGISVRSMGSNSSSENVLDKSSRLYPGDVYITKHSNLSEVHVVFHMVVDDGIRSSDITSRDPVILALRNVLKTCFRYDIYTITVPLLLTHEFYEDMTIQWCLKRAELILKCMKGFMMEMTTWLSQESRTIQFLVPKGLSEELFSSISNLVTQIFRLSNPVVARTS